MPGLVPGIHVFDCWLKKDMDGRDKPGHDDVEALAPNHAAFMWGTAFRIVREAHFSGMK